MKKGEARLLDAMDKGIRPYVEILRTNGIETYESCEGGKGHAYPEPTVRFYGTRAAGFFAFAVAIEHALPVSSLRRIWSVEDGEPVGPDWELVFFRKAKYGHG